MERKADDVFDPALFFGRRRSAVYEDNIRKITPGYETLHAMAARLIYKEIGEDGEVLVTGAGGGEELVEFSKWRPGWSLTGVDPSEPMIGIAKDRIMRDRISGRIKLHHGFVDHLPEYAQFDAATLLLVMHFLADGENGQTGAKQNILNQISKRLKPGAPLVIADFNGDQRSPKFDFMIEAWRDWQTNEGLDPEHVEGSIEHIKRDITFISEDRIFALLEAAGFQGVLRIYSAYFLSAWVTHKL